MSHRLSPKSSLRRPARGAAVGVLAIAAALLTACGGSSSDGGDAAATTSASSGTTSSSSAGESSSSSAVETITATEADFSITLDEDSLAAGEYQIEVVNEGQATHDLVVERDGEDVAATDPIRPGESATLTVTLEEGEYVFYCSIGNHRSMGMEVPVQVSS